MNLLVLGGTTEATALATAMAERGIMGTFSYAGRVERPKSQPLPTRIGGFGGADGLARWIRDHNITHVIDATHPFAAQMSRNAQRACTSVGIPLAALTRPPWRAIDGDNWQSVRDIPDAVEHLRGPARRILLAIGRLHLAEFAPVAHNFFLLRLVDPPANAPPLPNSAIEISRGPFTIDGDTDLMRKHQIDLVVSKNAGGTAARAKLDAARNLGIPVLMIDRPNLPDRTELHSVAAVFDWLSHQDGTDLGV